MNLVTKVIPLLALIFISTSSSAFTNVSNLKIPEFTVTTIDGDIISSKEALGKRPIYIVFWATWCPSCLREVPNLKAINEKYGDDIVFVAINVDRTHFWYNLTTSESKKPVRAYLKKQGINYNVALDDDKVLSDAFNVRGTPTQILINKQGELHQYFHRTPSNINSVIEKLINE
tara:strand:+ start:10695 stop:11216 length:522 start_codon:yes stop_codon:yes gene_type:complete